MRERAFRWKIGVGVPGARHRALCASPPPALVRPVLARLAVACVVAAMAASAPAQQGEPEAKNEEEPAATMATEITVTATLPELIPAESVSRRELDERGETDVAHALRYEPGVSAARRGSINLEPNVRALQEAQLTMLVDATRTFPAGPARMDSDLSHVTPNAVESIEIVKGPYALTWGAGAMAAIDVRTFRPDLVGERMRLGARGVAEYRSNGSNGDLYGQVFGASEDFRFQLLGNFRQGDDYEDGDGVEVPADYESEDYMWGIGGRVGALGTLDYSGGYQAQDDLDFAGRLLDATFFRTRSHRLAYGRSGGRGRLGELTASIYSNHKSHLMNNDGKPTALDMPGRVPPFGLRVELPTESDTVGGSFAATLHWDDARIKVGADAYENQRSATRRIYRRSNDFLIFDDIVWPDADAEDLGIYAQGIVSRQSYEAGVTLRVDSFEARAGEVSPFFAANTSGPLRQDESEWSAATSARLQVAESWSLLVGLGSVARFPDTLELYSDRFPSTRFQVAAEFMGDPALAPERSNEVDLGMVGAAGSVAVTADLFYRVIDDYVTVEPDPTLPKRLPLSPDIVFRYRNGTEATFWGGELRLEQRLGVQWSWRASLSYTRGEDELFDEPAFGVPPLTGQLGARFLGRDARLWLDAMVTLAAEQDRVATSRLEQRTAGFTVVDLTGGWLLRESLELLAGVENALDRRYVHHLNSLDPFARMRIAEPGRSFRMGLRWRR